MSVSLLLLLLNVAAAVIPVVGQYWRNTATSKQNETDTIVKGPIASLGGQP